ncbi:MAG TPA: bifunctional YncE family protein/alkaline phosphatase family protein [Gemmatimonadales bacterium]|nr:bifunctional YncE family protein/alkaline phosphatase family protein [Gemmatimonadales bacterium]
MRSSHPSVSMRAVPALVALMAAGCARGPVSQAVHRLPTGAMLDPAGPAVALGSMPLAMAFSPDSSRIVSILSGYRAQGIQVVDRASGRVIQTLTQPAAFVGLAFAPDGKTLFVSGGALDAVYRYAWRGDSAVRLDSIDIAPRGAQRASRYPAGVAVSPDGTRLYVAENLGDSLAVVDLASGKVVQRLATGRYPYGVAVTPDGTVFVSAWGGEWLAAFTAHGARLAAAGRIPVGRHPSAMALNPAGTRLYVALATKDSIAIVDTKARTRIGGLSDAASAGPGEGSTPDGLAVSADGHRLYVAEADNNAAAIYRLGAASSGDSSAVGGDSLLGRVPAEWYPTGVLARGDTLLVLNGKGAGAGPNPHEHQPGVRGGGDQRQYTLGQTTGSLMTVALGGVALDSLSARVARANGWDVARVTPKLPPFTHVIYVIKENRTYDQIFGDLPEGDGDTALVYFPRANTPNHHALAERFGVFDRFFVNAEVSADGHNWSTGAYAPDYVEKTVPSNYAGRGRDYDYEGENRGVIAEDDVDAPGTGYLWDLAERAGVSLRNYGEYAVRDSTGRWIGTKPFLAQHTDPRYPGWDLDTPDQTRADEWIRELAEFTKADTMPALEIMRLPNDHTSGARAGSPTPQAYLADNDLALGRVVEALSKSPFWKNTVMFVLEDDAQDGPDHVDSHRSPLLVISAYNHGGVIHRFTNTTDVLATIDAILHLGAMSQFDYYGRPLTEIFAATPDTSPYVALTPSVPLDQKNPPRTALARLSRGLDLRMEDRANEALFNRILWREIKGPERPYPGATRLALRDLRAGE